MEARGPGRGRSGDGVRLCLARTSSVRVLNGTQGFRTLLRTDCSVIRERGSAPDGTRWRGHGGRPLQRPGWMLVKCRARGRRLARVWDTIFPRCAWASMRSMPALTEIHQNLACALSASGVITGNTCSISNAGPQPRAMIGLALRGALETSRRLRRNAGLPFWSLRAGGLPGRDNDN
jgi:hypothetical protein